jgi:hypothetical protein
MLSLEDEVDVDEGHAQPHFFVTATAAVWKISGGLGGIMPVLVLLIV